MAPFNCVFLRHRDLELVSANNDVEDKEIPEYSLAEKIVRYFFAFKNLMDLLTILPFYIFLGVKGPHTSATVFLRVFRLLKIVRLYKGWPF